jgi:hypothetical protein
VKRVYAKVIAAAAATATAPLVIRSVVSGIDATALARMPDVKVIGRRTDGGIEIETPRYDLFTRVLSDIARQGGAIREIAGNDEIMVSLTVRDGAPARVEHGTMILRMKRDGFPGERLLVNVRMSDLAAFLNTYPLGDAGPLAIEHVFDY